MPLAIVRPLQAAAETPVPQAPLVAERPLVTSKPHAPAGQRAPVPVPTEIRSMVEARTGTDLAGVAVHRSPEVSATATHLSARAYTSGGEVHLPAEHGPLNSGPARALVAHELTHVAQQRTLGKAVPPEDSPGGMRLETQAVQNERAVSEGSMQPDQTSVKALSNAGGLPLVRQRAPLQDGGGHPPTPAAAAVAAGIGTRRLDGSVHFRPAPIAGAGVQRAVEIDEPVTTAEVHPGPGAAAGPTSGESLDGDDGGDVGKEQELDELARRLWPRLHERLREDLVVARERAGTLVDRF